MSEPLCRLANEARCLCSNDSPLRFRRFHDREADELLGLQCLTCEKEYLKETFVKYLNLASHILKPGRYRLYLAEKVHLPEDSAHMVPLLIDEINVKLFHNNLKPGDHVAWKRPWGYLHHAIITEINNGNKIRVVHWHSNIGTNPGPGCKIQEQWIVLEEEWGILYRVNYSEEIVKANPTRLVIARARSRIGEKGYHLIRDNCETFASFCKSGLAISKQIRWVFKELKNECKKSGLQTFAKVALSELMEQAVSHEQWVGLSLVVVLEGIHTYIDVQDLWKARNEGKMTKKVVIEQITERITQAVFCGGLAGAGSAVPVVGLIIGFFGGIMGKWIGSMAGPHVGQFITSRIEYDDRAICKITELQFADHLVLGYDGEGSHHCIVARQRCDDKKNQISVIHNTEKDGVIQEWIDFIQPVYKVIYEEKDGPTPDEIWSKAESMLGKKEYDVKAFNSKHFAQLCCKK